MDKETNYNELESKNVSNQASTDNLSNDNTIHHQSTIQNEESQDNRLMAMLIYLLVSLVLWLFGYSNVKSLDLLMYLGKRIWTILFLILSIQQ